MSIPLSSEPLSEDQLNVLEDVLEKYRTEASVLNVSELDGFFTAVVSGPAAVGFDDWYTMLWGAPEYLPVWNDEQEFEQFFTLLIQHMNNIATMLTEYPEDFEPLFNEVEVDGEMLLVVEDWCFGYMRGMSVGNGWPVLPEDQQQYLSAIILHTEEDDLLEGDNPLQIDAMEVVGFIPAAAVQLQQYWLGHRVEFLPRRVEPKTGRNDPCPCGSGKKFKQCCLH
ncbi:UPF0149 family protein [Pseudomonas sp. dw_358]|uniref:UPF0149 family protein n=1 Tax=Pseudomonas sp. dw_358 TaxID=2720083 RepID=UPI001BD42C51|nr:UPF0149 family protein [Pseudomonas sp. dw_358]